MGEVETMVEDNMEEEEDHSEPPWSSHPRTWWSALAISSRFPVEELVRWCGAGKVLPSHPLPTRLGGSSPSPMQTLLTPVSMFVEAVESPARLGSPCKASELRHKLVCGRSSRPSGRARRSPGGSARASGIVEVEPREAPRLEVYPEAEQTISVGGSVLYQCRAVAGIPSPEIQWTRQGGGRLTSNAEVLSGGVLRITRVTGSEAGSYVCTATNTAGRATIVTSLNIQKPPTVRLQPSGSLQIVLGRPLRLECLVEGEPR